ncbi:hypothetical protein HF086_008994 [Spodoptera exigua]|uniref:Uncharacterized protein n=1 Tax=Spodoptera exigua TaxID=7107 RepID=A0A922MKT8_SPOEX|nr:hypothetical protein HF086_008994 [Spodoptera exigua]
MKKSGVLKGSEAVNAYCSVPCPFFYPASPTVSYAAYPGAQPRKNIYTESEDDAKESPPAVKQRQPEPEPRTKSKDEKTEEEVRSPSPTRRKSSPNPETPPTPNSATNSPNRRFFTSLFSIPGAVMDTLLSGEIVL